MSVTDDDWMSWDALAMASLVKQRKISSTELVEHALSRIEKLNPAINAIVRLEAEEARANAGVIAGSGGGPFEGVPFLFKEVGPTEAGKTISFSSRFFDGFLGSTDSTILKRYRASGLVNLGRSSAPELGLCPASEPAMFGPCRNPWNLNMQSGGSSGGAAAAVAARLVPVAQGSDGGGSIRLPASHCGVYGMKPSRGRTPYGPYLGEGWGGFVAMHVLSLSVRDSAAALDATHGAEVGDPYAAPPVARPYLEEIERETGKLRIAVVTRSAAGTPAHPEVCAAVEETARLLESMGHLVEPFELPYDERLHLDDFWVIVKANAAALIAARAAELGRQPTLKELEPITYGLYREAKHVDSVRYAASIQRCHNLGRKFGQMFEQFDVLLSPVFADPPQVLGTFSMQRSDTQAYFEECRQGMPFTWWFNVTGCPAASLPLGMTQDGLPIGVQIGCSYGRDDLVLNLSAKLEAAKPWIKRIPALALAGAAEALNR